MVPSRGKVESWGARKQKQKIIKTLKITGIERGSPEGGIKSSKKEHGEGREVTKNSLEYQLRKQGVAWEKGGGGNHNTNPEKRGGGASEPVKR